ncbi:MAG TPA: SRPBCC family protein [Candidatus Dormibacteraeota bacterium]|nr:SRPBCC family protein [Candidatus Dormibacteraeota bacterium]
MTDYAHLVRSDRVHRRLYVDQDIFADEMERIFGRSWVYLAHQSELPSPLDEAMADLGRRMARIASYRGLIFGSRSDDVPPLAEHLGAVAGLLDQWLDRAPDGEVFVGHGTRVISARANWKLYLDGAADGLHPLFTHRSYLELSSQRSGSRKFLSEFRADPDRTAMYAQVLGDGHQFLDQRPTRQPSLWSAMPKVPGTEHVVAQISARYGDRTPAVLERTAFAAMNIFVFPNLSIVENAIGVICPLAVNRTEVRWSRVSLRGAEPEALPLQMRLAEESDGFIDVDDIENWERAQEGLEAVPEAEWLHTGRGLGLPSTRDDRGVETVAVTNEAPMRAYQAEWLRLMTRRPD